MEGEGGWEATEIRERGVEGEEERKGGLKDKERPLTLKCRKIHSFPLILVIKSSQEAR